MKQSKTDVYEQSAGEKTCNNTAMTKMPNSELETEIIWWFDCSKE